jgi:methionine-rich copper-binding protein CopC
MFTNVLRVAALAAVGALVVGGPVLGIASPAQAHNYLVSSTPVAGETLTELPDAFEITTNEPLLALDGTGGFAFQVVDAAGLHYESGCVTVDGATMSTEPRLGEAGEYTALWQVVSADGHTVSDTIDFTWAPADGVEASAGAASAPACDDGAAGPATPETSEPQTTPPSTVPLGDVLWIGGAVLAVGIAIAVTIVLLGRRKAT